MSNRAFVEFVFSKKVGDAYSKIIKEIVPETSLYNSPVAEHIRGDMTSVLHCTIFFGLDPSYINDPELNKLVEEATFKEIKLGDLFFIEGYQNLYRVLCISVLDEDNRLYEFSKKIEKFVDDKEFRPREFKPHLTLAYVTQDYKLPEKLPELLEKLQIDKIQVTLVSDFNKRVGEKVISFK